MNPKFNLVEWSNLFSQEDLLPEDGLAVVNLPSIVGPHDVCKIALCRKLMEAQVKWGKPEYIDYFIWAQGEGSVIGSTRLGGRPDLPAPEHWPRGLRGEFLPFIGQINFSDSRDLVDVPSEVVLIFAHLVNGCVEEYKLLWEDCSQLSRLEPDRLPPTAFDISPHHAYLCRLEVFPRASPIVAPQEHYVSMRGKKLYHFADLLRPSGSCIGGYVRKKKYLAIVNCLTPTSRVIYPYLNREKPYTLAESSEEWTNANSQRLTFLGEYPLSPLESTDFASLPALDEYPSRFFEFSDCGSLLLLQTVDGSFELQTSSF